MTSAFPRFDPAQGIEDPAGLRLSRVPVAPA